MNWSNGMSPYSVKVKVGKGSFLFMPQKYHGGFIFFEDKLVKK